MTLRPILRLSSPWDVKDSIDNDEVGRNMCLRLYVWKEVNEDGIHADGYGSSRRKEEDV